MEKKKFFSAKNIAYLGILLALVIVLQWFASEIPIGDVQLNLALIPIVLGAIMFGMAGGAFLGAACGIVVLIQVLVVPKPFYTTIWTYSPVLTSFICLIKTTAAGLVAGLLYKVIAKKSSIAAVFVAAGIVPIINTTLFILGCLCMSNTMTIFRDMLVNDFALEKFDGMNIFVFILVGIVTFNFFIEFALNMVFAPAIHRVVLVVEKKIGKKKGNKAASENEATVPAEEGAATPSEEGEAVSSEESEQDTQEGGTVPAAEGETTPSQEEKEEQSE